MKKQAYCLVIASMLLTVGSFSVAHAQADFFGVKMKSESYASQITPSELKNAPSTLADREGMDKLVYAFAYFRNSWNSLDGLEIEIFNQTDKPVMTEYVLSHYWVVTKDGRKINLKDPGMVWQPATDYIPAKGRATYNPSLQGIHITKDDIQYIVCSFNLDETKVVLVRLPQAPKPVPVKKINTPKPVKSNTPKKIAKPSAPKVVKEKTAKEKTVNVTPKKKEVKKPTIKIDSTPKEVAKIQAPAPVASPSKDYRAPTTNFTPGNVHQKIQEAVKRQEAKVEPKKQEPVVTIPSKPKQNKSQTVQPKAKSSNKPSPQPKVLASDNSRVEDMYSANYGRFVRNRFGAIATIQEVNKVYGFVVVDVGAKDKITSGTVLNIIRDGKLIGKATVEELKEYVSGATIIPEWTKVKFKIGDQISRF